ncbi:translation initiation factor IF-2-like [Equus quagga]|uniref:translation initiation factor IF-2-like n=1 Tax=Equus quagga TaxID=89248 RepID=UPI001EE165D8|nr:translation initiation factor IF-2-like [Equus quagga]
MLPAGRAARRGAHCRGCSQRIKSPGFLRPYGPRAATEAAPPSPAPSAWSRLDSQPSTDARGFQPSLPWTPRLRLPDSLSRRPSALIAPRRALREPGRHRPGPTSRTQERAPGAGRAAPPPSLPASGTRPGPRPPRERLLPSPTAIPALSASSSPRFFTLLSVRRWKQTNGHYHVPSPRVYVCERDRDRETEKREKNSLRFMTKEDFIAWCVKQEFKSFHHWAYFLHTTIFPLTQC